MADSFSFDIQGGKELSDQLGQLTQKEMRAALRKSSRKAMKPVYQAAKDKALSWDDPDTPIAIWRNVATRGRWDKSEQAQVTSVGVLGGARYRSNASQDHPFYWRFKELGTEHQRADPFLRPALENNSQQVLADLTSDLRKQLMKGGS